MYIDFTNNKKILIELLKKYKRILNKEKIEYLNSLLELEFSIINNNISDNDRKILQQLDIYNKIGLYNICNKAFNIFNDDNFNKDLYEYQDGIIFKITAPLNNKKITLFKFVQCYENNKLGDISLFQTIESKEQKEKEILLILNKLEKLYDKKNPYRYEIGFSNGPAPNWAQEHKKEIALYEKMFMELDNKINLTYNDTKEIEITNKYYNLLLNDYGLTNDSFYDITNPTIKNYSYLNKKLVKKIPGINIYNNIKYI